MNSNWTGIESSGAATGALTGTSDETSPWPRGRLDSELRFAHKIDVAVPPTGLGERFNAMLDWCGERLHPDFWNCHGHTDPARRDASGQPMDFTRFYFLEQADAAAFRHAWL